MSVASNVLSDDDTPDARSPIISSGNRLKIAAFAMNCQRGATATTAEGSIATLDWGQQVRIAQATEEAGLEAIIPVARWRGQPGPSRFLRESYETLPWAAGIAAVTKRIAVFATVHVPLVHPIRAAKELVTVDHISGGRVGLNVVCGWNVAEFAMFGKQQREHDDRYAEGAEWISVVKRLWRDEEPFDWSGQYFHGESLIGEPRPLQKRPVLMSAGSSPAGRDFAAGHADICFVTSFGDTDQLRAAVKDIKERAARVGRVAQVWIFTGILCAETEAEVQRQYNYFVHEKGDWIAAEASINSMAAGNSTSLKLDQSKKLQEHIIAFYGAHHVMGTPTQIVDKLNVLADAGVDGLAAVWLDYEKGIENFRQQILPLAIRAGLRTTPK